MGKEKEGATFLLQNPRGDEDEEGDLLSFSLVLSQKAFRRRLSLSLSLCALLCSFDLLGRCQAVGRKKTELLKSDNPHEVMSKPFARVKPSKLFFSLRDRRILVASLVLCCRLPSNLCIYPIKSKSFASCSTLLKKWHAQAIV